MQALSSTHQYAGKGRGVSYARTVFGIALPMSAWFCLLGLPLWALAEGCSYWFGEDESLSVYFHGLRGLWASYGVMIALTGIWFELLLIWLTPLPVHLRRAAQAQIERLEVGHPLVVFTEQIATELGAKSPELYIAKSELPNAFALSKGQPGAIVINAGLIRNLEKGELAFVLAHEISHIRNGDAFSGLIWLACSRSTMWAIRAREMTVNVLHRVRSRPSLLIDFLFGPVYLFVHFAGMSHRFTLSAYKLIDLWIGRHMEYRADREGAAIAGAHSAECVIHMLRRGIEPSWGVFSTHPPTDRRIKNIRAS